MLLFFTILLNFFGFFLNMWAEFVIGKLVLVLSKMKDLAGPGSDRQQQQDGEQARPGLTNNMIDERGHETRVM